jgi:hypothetical protein
VASLCGAAGAGTGVAGVIGVTGTTTGPLPDRAWAGSRCSGGEAAPETAVAAEGATPAGLLPTDGPGGSAGETTVAVSSRCGVAEASLAVATASVPGSWSAAASG